MDILVRIPLVSQQPAAGAENLEGFWPMLTFKPHPCFATFSVRIWRSGPQMCERLYLLKALGGCLRKSEGRPIPQLQKVVSRPNFFRLPQDFFLNPSKCLKFHYLSIARVLESCAKRETKWYFIFQLSHIWGPRQLTFRFSLSYIPNTPHLDKKGLPYVEIRRFCLGIAELKLRLCRETSSTATNSREERRE